MKRSCLYVLIGSLCGTLLLSACATSAPRAATLEGGFSSAFTDQEKIAFVRDHCYEVLLAKSKEDSLSYEKPLDFSVLDYRSRMDAYHSIGTAFAIGPREFVTAAHVLTLQEESRVYTERFIRTRVSEGGKMVDKVYELDQILSMDVQRDYVVFTVKDLVLDTWLPTAPAPSFNSKVFTAGNAYGEGVVIREGLLLDEVPENRNGDWMFLKSSIATNPGNSGGPLLDDQYRVIGIVLQKKDDFCYSLGMKDMINGVGRMSRGLWFGFTVLNTRINKTFNWNTSVPVHYKKVMSDIAKKMDDFYMEGMGDLFTSLEAETFPNGDNALRSLYNSSFSFFPQVYLQDSDDKSWFLSKSDNSYSDIGSNGAVNWAEMYKDAGIWLMSIRHPDGIDPGVYIQDPKTMMDTLLKGIQIKRKLSNSDPGTRIVSAGTPKDGYSFSDRWGRRWFCNEWLYEYSDQSIITMSTPTPRGVILLYKACDSSDRFSWKYDLQKLTDFVTMSYYGTIPEWKAFLSNQDNKVGPFASVKMEFLPDTSSTITVGSVDATFTKDMISISDDNEIGLTFTIHPVDGKPSLSLRRLFYQEKIDSDTFFVLYKWLKPDSKLPKSYITEWDERVLRRVHPYSGTPYNDEGHSAVADIHPACQVPESGEYTRADAWSLYAARQTLTDDAAMKELLKAYGENVSIGY